MFLRVFLLLLRFSSFSVRVFAQCGTIVTPAQIKFEYNHRVANRFSGSVKPIHCLNKTLSLAIHIVTDSLHQTNVTQLEINNAIFEMNKDFAPICLDFKICKQDTIYNHQYDSLVYPRTMGEVHHLYDIPKMINVYIVSKIFDPYGGEFDGWASFTEDWLVICKDVAMNDKKNWSHQMGHFFSLYHTHETAFGTELADESNCETAGDLICDTDGDATGPLDINVTANAPYICTYIGTSTDPAGNYYTPILGNIMSSHHPKCKCAFTVQQLNRMAEYFLTYRNYLY